MHTKYDDDNNLYRSSQALIDQGERNPSGFSPKKSYLYKYDLKNKQIDGKVKQVLSSYNSFNKLNQKSNSQSTGNLALKDFGVTSNDEDGRKFSAQPGMTNGSRKPSPMDWNQTRSQF